MPMRRIMNKSLLGIIIPHPDELQIIVNDNIEYTKSLKRYGGSNYKNQF